MPDANIYLSVLSDDFGMCEAINEGIAQAYTGDVLTDTVLMAPCPAFAEAIERDETPDRHILIHARIRDGSLVGCRGR